MKSPPYNFQKNMVKQTEAPTPGHEFCRNKFGVKIKKCCASCAEHEPYDADGPQRLCTFYVPHKIVKKGNVCKNWHISEMMYNIKCIGHGI